MNTTKTKTDLSRRTLVKAAGLAAAGSLTAGFVTPSRAQRHSRTFLLVHGAWHGSFVWRELAPKLRAAGHSVTAPTLTGLGERKHTLNDLANLETHIQDIVNHIEMEDLHDIDLVGWSYGGMVTTGVLARVTERIRSMIYLDAFVPDNGKALIDYAEGPVVPLFNESRINDTAIPPIPLEVFGVQDDSIKQFVNPRLVPQPWRTTFQPVDALATRPDIPFTYVHCLGFVDSPFGYFHDKFKAEGVNTFEIQASHLCMLDAVDTVADILLTSA
ncbi:alpha/beta fold hydrolase [Saccharospirillum mangrovi]|uniref:alpha/beta fold hydrolase n=1 Tax=Saccharospirillum mangrovi TaxID=2161747 RepID=UPI000D33C3EC|nr:alpha/beta hydrolase [Saccharospirillum mangrovi]